MSLEVKGILEKFLPVQSGEKKDGSGTWSKQSFLVRTTDEYNNLYCFEVFGDDKVANLTKFQKEGDEIKVTFNVSTSDEWKGKYFTSLSVYRIEPASGGMASDNAPKKSSDTADQEDDLPF